PCLRLPRRRNSTPLKDVNDTSVVSRASVLCGAPEADRESCVMADVASDVLEVIAKQAKTDAAKVTRETELADLNLESLDTIELIFALEEKFNIEIPYNANEATTAGINFTTAGDVIDAVAK